MRRTIVALAVVALGMVGTAGAAITPPLKTSTPTLKQCLTLVKREVLTKGHMTIATDDPVYSPWFIDNDPANAEGYEGALAYDIASKLGFPAKDVTWVVEHYAQSYQPGTKDFDFDINEIVYTPAWKSNIEFSESYYNVTQSLVAMDSDPIVLHHTPAKLKTYHYGALTGSPAAAYVTNKIKPKTPVTTFAGLPAAVAALETGQIDALAIDTPTGNYVATTDILGDNGAHLATQVGQFPYDGDEYYALILQKANPLLACVNVAITTLTSAGKVAALQATWLSAYQKVPVISP